MQNAFPINNHTHSHQINFIDQMLKIFPRSKFRINTVEIFNRIITSQSSFDRMNRHEPNTIDIQFFQACDMILKNFESSFNNKFPNVYFVDCSVLNIPNASILGPF